MKYDIRKITGALLFVGSVQFLLVVIIAEALYPGYNVSKNWISDLGVGTTAILFNSSVFLLGLFVAASAYFFQHTLGNRNFSILLLLTGVGAMGVGLFPENFGIIHGLASMAVFVFGSLSALMSYRLQRTPISYISVLLGATSLLAYALSISGTHLGIGKGGMERMIVYPIILWVSSFGSHLMGMTEYRA